jgi:hypothetical protein
VNIANSSSNFQSSALDAGAGVASGNFESASSSSFETSSYGGGGNGSSGFDLAGAIFRNIDSNNDGTIDQAEFNRFFQKGL